MNKVVNLNKFKKKKSKEARQREAETNRRLHGRTKAERASEALQKQKLESAVDHARLQSESLDGMRARSAESEPRDQEHEC
jgi:Domain of unknown function (DUF4169)